MAVKYDGSRCLDCLEPIKGVVVNGETVKGDLDGNVHRCKQRPPREARTRGALLNFLERNEGKK